MQEWLDPVLGWLAGYGLKIVAALAIFIIGRIVVGILTGVVQRLLARAGTDETLARFVSNLAKGLLLTFVIIAAVSALGIETTSFIAVLGAAGLAVGFALQSSLSNLASGVMLIMFQPFKQGDYVKAGGVAGTIEEVAIFNTVMKSPDNRKIIVPNGSIIGGSITNYSANQTRRIDLVIGVGYGDDLKKARQILERIIGEEARILADPETFIGVSELADSSVNLVVWPWVKTSDYWNVRCDLIEKIKLTFDAEGISIPYPQQDVHMHTVESPAA